jgi:hypothetical protein
MHHRLKNLRGYPHPLDPTLLTALCCAGLMWADEPKNHDFDLIRDEAGVPAYHLHGFGNTRDDGHDPHPDHPGFLRDGIPRGELLQRGFGFVVVQQGDLLLPKPRAS